MKYELESGEILVVKEEGLIEELKEASLKTLSQENL